MAVRPEFRWWILTLVIVGILVGISALALLSPSVVWEDGEPHCPHCRTEVPPYGSRCPTCNEEYDWSVAPPEESPFSPWSLSALEAELMRSRVKELGREASIDRAVAALGLERAAAIEYLDHVGRGRCGWCGGTGRDLEKGATTGDDCPACLGTGRCVACGGDRRMRMGDEAAAQGLRAYSAGIADMRRSRLPPDVEVEEVRRLARIFLERHAATKEAEGILFWKTWAASGPPTTVVRACRTRVDGLLAELLRE